jgi:hypothetical protein
MRYIYIFYFIVKILESELLELYLLEEREKEKLKTK